MAADSGIVIVASPDLELVLLARSLGAEAYHADSIDEEDVLTRYIAAAKHFELGRIIRVCGDCPMIDPEDIRRLAEQSTDLPYVAFWDVDNHRPAIVGHAGKPELIHLGELEHISEFCGDCREHVTHGIYKRPRPAWRTWIRQQGIGSLRLTIDTPEDVKEVERCMTSQSLVA